MNRLGGTGCADSLCSLALSVPGSGLCWSSDGFVKYLRSLDCVLRMQMRNFHVKHPQADTDRNSREKSDKRIPLVENV